MNVFSCYIKTLLKEYDRSIEYYFVTSENWSTIRGKYFNLINVYEPSLINHDVMFNCFKKHGEKATL